MEHEAHGPLGPKPARVHRTWSFGFYEIWATRLTEHRATGDGSPEVVSKTGHQSFDDVDLKRQLQNDARWSVQWYKRISDKDTVALLDPSLQSIGPLRASESEAYVFWDPNHLARRADC